MTDSASARSARGGPRHLVGPRRAAARQRRHHQHELHGRGRRPRATSCASARTSPSTASCASTSSRPRAPRPSSASRRPCVHAEPGVLVLEFVEGRTLDEADIRDPAMLGGSCRCSSACHREMARQVAAPALMFWVFHIVRHYAPSSRRASSRHVASIPQSHRRAATRWRRPSGRSSSSSATTTSCRRTSSTTASGSG